MTSFDLGQKWKNATLIGVDLETSGKYPIDSEICEMAAIKWRQGEIIDKYTCLIKPSKKMTEEVIAIHNITNEMVASAPSIKEKIEEFYNFIQDGYMIAHHAPFDLGFLSIDFENKGLKLPDRPVFCSSLISRKAISETENHKLQTLIKYFGIPAGQAHRALDDANACLELAIKCFERIGAEKTLEEIILYQETDLRWPQFSMKTLKDNKIYCRIVEAAEKKEPIQIVYQGGSQPGQARTVYPIGVVRNPKDDFLVAKSELEDEIPKRFFLKKITGSNF